MKSSVPAVHGANVYDFTELVAENAEEFEKEIFEGADQSFPIYTDQTSLQVRAAGPRTAKQWVINFPEDTDAEKVK